MRAAPLFVALLSLLAAPAWAQLEISIEGGTIAAQPLAVVPFANGSLTPVAPLAAAPAAPVDVAAIIETDLAHSGQFSALPRSQMLETPSEPGAVDFKNWRVNARDYLIVGSVLPTADANYTVRFYLLDVVRQQRLLGLDMPAVPASRLREIAHRVSDLVFEKLTGQRGLFSTEIAYITASGYGFSRRYELVIADADGGNPRTVVSSREPLLSPSWSPDGQQLAYVGFDQVKSAIWLYDRNSGKIRKLVSEKGINGAPSFSPDGKSLVITLSFETNPDLYLLNIETGTRKRLTDSRAIDTEGSFSPDGSQIAFTSDRGGNAQVYVIPASGGIAKRISFTGRQNLRPRFSPDGQKLAMVTGEKGKYLIALSNADGTGYRRLTQGPQEEGPSFAPTGSAIIFASAGRSGAQLGVATLDGEHNYTLRQAGEVREPAWGPLPPAIAGLSIQETPTLVVPNGSNVNIPALAPPATPPLAQ